MSEPSTNVAKFRVELANKAELRDFFAQTATAVKKFGQDVKADVKPAAAGITEVTKDVKELGAVARTELKATGTEVSQAARVTVDAAGRMRDATGRFVQGAGSAAQSARQLGQAAGEGGRSLAGLGGHAGAAARSSQALAGALGGELSSALGSVASMAGSAAKGLLALTGVGAGIGVVGVGKGIIELDDGVAGLAATAGLADDKIASLREQILDTSDATRVMGKDLVEAASVFVAKTGDIDTARQNLKLYGDTAKATRASVVEIAAIGADLRKLGITDQAAAFGILAKQADVGAVELKDLVSQGPRLLSAFMGAGLTGERGLREGGALAQVTQSATGNVERTSTSVEAVFRDLAEKEAQLRKGGINVFDPTTHRANDRVEVLLQTIRSTGGREDLLRRIFGDEAMRAVNPLASEFRSTGGFATYESFRDASADPAIMERKRQLNMGTAASKLEAAQVDVQNQAARRFASTLNDAADSLGRFTGAITWAMDNPGSAGALAVGGLAVGGLAKRGLGAAARYAGGRFQSLLRGGAGAVEEAAGALSGEDGARVYVTNWPAGMGGAEGVLGGGGAAQAARSAVPALAGAVGAELALPLAGIAAGLASQVAVLADIGQNRDDMGAQWRREHQSVIDLEQQMLARRNGAAPGAPRPTAPPLPPSRFVTAGQVGGARAGVGSDGLSPEEVLARQKRQLGLLGVLARAEESGVSQDFLIENSAGMEDVIAAVAERFPQIRKAKSGKERARLIRRFMKEQGGGAGSVQALFDGPSGGTGSGGAGQVVESPYWAGSPGQPQPVALALTVNIAGDEVTLEGNTGTRSPKVMVRRTAGGM